MNSIFSCSTRPGLSNSNPKPSALTSWTEMELKPNHVNGPHLEVLFRNEEVVYSCNLHILKCLEITIL